MTLLLQEYRGYILKDQNRFSTKPANHFMFSAASAIKKGYNFKGDSILPGSGMLEGKPTDGIQVSAPLKMFNRHGLISGATVNGKTKALQGITEALSN